MKYRTLFAIVFLVFFIKGTYGSSAPSSFEELAVPYAVDVSYNFSSKALVITDYSIHKQQVRSVSRVDVSQFNEEMIRDITEKHHIQIKPNGYISLLRSFDPSICLVRTNRGILGRNMIFPVKKYNVSRVFKYGVSPADNEYQIYRTTSTSRGEHIQKLLNEFHPQDDTDDDGSGSSSSVALSPEDLSTVSPLSLELTMNALGYDRMASGRFAVYRDRKEGDGDKIPQDEIEYFVALSNTEENVSLEDLWGQLNEEAIAAEVKAHLSSVGSIRESMQKLHDFIQEQDPNTRTYVRKIAHYTSLAGASQTKIDRFDIRKYLRAFEEALSE